MVFLMDNNVSRHTQCTGVAATFGEVQHFVLDVVTGVRALFVLYIILNRSNMEIKKEEKN